MKESPALKSCIVNRLYAYSVGRKVGPDEKPLLKYYENILEQRGFRFEEMLRLMIFDKSFFAIGAPETLAASNNAPTEVSYHAHQD